MTYLIQYRWFIFWRTLYRYRSKKRAIENLGLLRSEYPMVKFRMEVRR